MPTKQETLDKIINIQESLIRLLKDNLNIVNNPAKKIAFLNHIKGKDLKRIQDQIVDAYISVNKESFRGLF